jgi:NAD(P)-dependent dehydrogenase (short-subunit alcohol dehydrogenase family)
MPEIKGKKTAVIIGGQNRLMDSAARLLLKNGVDAVARFVNTAWNAADKNNVSGYDTFFFSGEEEFFKESENALGKYGKPDYFVYCALPDTDAGRGGALPETHTDFWLKTKEEGLDMIYHASSAFLSAMAEKGGGRVLILGTSAGVMPVKGQDAVSSMSAAAFMAMKSIALDCAADGIIANALALGASDNTLGITPMPADETLIRHIPLKRICTEDEILNVIEYLLLKAPDYLTGNVLVLDGALTTAYMRDW